MKSRLPLYDPARAEGRRCGSCTGCCTALAVAQIEKAEFQKCRHLRGGSAKGCGVYADRPSDCRDWRCMWLLGLGSSKDRPDKLGIILDAEKSEPLGCYVIKVFELRQGAHNTPQARELIQRVVESAPPSIVLLIRSGGRRALLGGEHAATERALRLLESSGVVVP